MTMAYNVPRNNALATVDPGERRAAARTGPRYLAGWTAWNHVRTVASLIALGLEIGALYVKPIAPTRLTWPARRALYR